MNAPKQFLLFSLDNLRFALPLPNVERVVPAIEVTTLPNAPLIVLGIVNIRGRIIPVVDIRCRFSLPSKDIMLSDQLIIAATSKRPVCIVADEVYGVIECGDEDIIAPAEILPGMEHVKGVIKLKDGITLIHDIDGFLSLDEEKALDDAMREA
ncbi:MAG: purine-binding chemotaxis protein CheW [Deltaproteobacteria bacterium]|nr:purine-binding chemotaxis protein CheW [Deltaproteobacteria bacterium]